MHYSIIINTFNQYKYLAKCITSCLNQVTQYNFEVICIDTTNIINNKIYIPFKKNKKFKLICHKPFSKNPIIDQLLKIKFATKYAKGNIILLCDGDDFFQLNKISEINSIFNCKKVSVVQNKYYSILNNKKTLHNHIKIFKSWPDIFSTSCLAVKKTYLINFYKNNVFNSNTKIAIDARLVILAYFQKKLININKYLTNKTIHNNNLDKNFSNIFSFYFWERRYEQFLILKKYKKKLINFDFLLTLTFYYFLKFYRKIIKRNSSF